MVHVIDLRGNVPLYGQQSCNWCGAASAQMIMNGYPNAADRLFYPQGPPTVPPGLTNCWDVIQANNSTNATDVAQRWASDPIGLRECLKLLNPPPGGNWVVFADPSRDAVLFDILYWMNRNRYPVATLINQGGHWVVIVHYETDVEPVAGSSPTLQKITKYDPEPHNVGSVSTMTPAVWNATDWNGAVGYAGTWLNNYVAVIEPPVTKGVVKIRKVTRIGKKIITPEKAVELAKESVEKRRYSTDPKYAMLSRKGIRNIEPFLVREQKKPAVGTEEKVPYYYIVPFGFEMEKGQCGVPLARIAVIINAFTGDFEEITAFGKPVRYLPEKEATAIAAIAMGLDKSEVKEVKATMMFVPSDITHIRAYPFWKIETKERAVYIDQLGAVYGAIRRSVPGD